VGIFRPIVEPFVLVMLHTRQDLVFRCPITLQLIGNDHTRDVLEPFEQFTEKSLGGLLVAATLHKDVKYLSVLIHGSPQVMSLATDREEDLVQMPRVATAWATTTAFIGVRLPELQTPLPNGFRADNDPTLGQKLFTITKTEREAEREPDCVADNLGWEAIAFIIGSNGICFHEAILTHCSALFMQIQYHDIVSA